MEANTTSSRVGRQGRQYFFLGALSAHGDQEMEDGGNQ